MCIFIIWSQNKHIFYVFVIICDIIYIYINKSFLGIIYPWGTLNSLKLIGNTKAFRPSWDYSCFKIPYWTEWNEKILHEFGDFNFLLEYQIWCGLQKSTQDFLRYEKKYQLIEILKKIEIKKLDSIR